MDKICKKCGKVFGVEQEDLDFYKKINVPLPTLCPGDRMQRRWSWRSKSFYLRECDNCHKKVMSWISPKLTKIKAYCEYCFISDDFDAMIYGRDFDFSRSFFAQMEELMRQVPRHISNAVNNENSEYIISAHNNKNCYFVDEIDGSWDCYFGYNIQYCKNIVEGLYVRDSEIGFELIKAEGCYKVFCSQNVFNCRNSAFLMNCRNCTNCLFSCNLNNEQYLIFNKKVSPEEFKRVWDSVFTVNQIDLDLSRKKFEEFLATQVISQKVIVNCEDCTGNYLSNCKNVKDSFCIDNCKDCRFCTDIHYSKDSYDVNIYEGELMYESIHVGPDGYGQFFSQLGWFSSNIYYCVDIRSCRNCFGCVGIKRKQFCILNKQYSEEEYEKLLPKIIEHMGCRAHSASAQRGEESGSASSEPSELENQEYGDFFPMEMSPLAYNTTMAQRYFPLSKEEVLQQGLNWEDREIRKEFRITEAEKNFHNRYGIPLPTIHPVERIERLLEKLNLRNQ